MPLRGAGSVDVHCVPLPPHAIPIARDLAGTATSDAASARHAGISRGRLPPL